MASPADDLYRLARKKCEQGLFEEGIALAREAIALDPQEARAHQLAGMALARTGRYADALASLDQVIALGAATVDIYGARADALAAMGRLSEAVESYDGALKLEPDSVEDWLNRGAVLMDLGRTEDALASFTHVAALDPDFAQAHYNRGNALIALDRHADAVAAFDRAITLDPGYVDALNNRANALDRLGNQREALAGVDRALSLDAGHRGALITRGVILRKLGRPEPALASLDRALSLAPGDADALAARADALIELERFEEAAAALDQVIARKPDDAAPKWNKSILCLGLGRFRDGWKLYEHRWAGASGLVPRAYPQTRWNGGRVHGTLLVWSEQGLGDEILYSSMMPDLLARTDQVVLEVEPRLVALMQRSFPTVTVIPLKPELYSGNVAVQEPLGGLGLHFRPTFEDFPKRDRGYLVADAVRAAELRSRVAGDGKFVIGLSWLSKAVSGKSKSASLREFEPLLRLPNCRFVDLQYGDTAADRTTVERELGIRIERLDIDNTNDIDGLAALITACDAVVTVSNVTAHLAGALGRPTWVLVPHGVGRLWFWFHAGNDSPWYPRVRVFRQQRARPWSELMPVVVKEISALIESPRR